MIPRDLGGRQGYTPAAPGCNGDGSGFDGGYSGADASVGPPGEPRAAERRPSPRCYRETTRNLVAPMHFAIADQVEPLASASAKGACHHWPGVLTSISLKRMAEKIARLDTQYTSDVERAMPATPYHCMNSQSPQMLIRRFTALMRNRV
jgi:hypothetical protein